MGDKPKSSKAGKATETNAAPTAKAVADFAETEKLLADLKADREMAAAEREQAEADRKKAAEELAAAEEARKQAEAATAVKGTGAAPAANSLTVAQAANRVTGLVRAPAMKDGKPVSEKGVFKITERSLTAEDVLAFAERDGRVTVVTIDGQRLSEAA